MPSCAILGCLNTSDRKGEGLSFHRIPLDGNRQTKWKSALGLTNYKYSKNTRICSIHFSENCFDKSSPRKVRIKEDAVPTIFPNMPSSLQPNKPESLEGELSEGPRIEYIKSSNVDYTDEPSTVAVVDDEEQAAVFTGSSLLNSHGTPMHKKQNCVPLSLEGELSEGPQIEYIMSSNVDYTDEPSTVAVVEDEEQAAVFTGSSLLNSDGTPMHKRQNCVPLSLEGELSEGPRIEYIMSSNVDYTDEPTTVAVVEDEEQAAVFTGSSLLNSDGTQMHKRQNCVPLSLDGESSEGPQIEYITSSNADHTDEPSTVAEVEDEEKAAVSTGSTQLNSDGTPMHKKRKTEKIVQVDNGVDDASNILEQMANKPKAKKDDAYLFCELLSSKLRGLDEDTREIAMHDIESFMFNLKRFKSLHPKNSIEGQWSNLQATALTTIMNPFALTIKKEKLEPCPQVNQVQTQFSHEAATQTDQDQDLKFLIGLLPYVKKMNDEDKSMIEQLIMWKMKK